MKKIVIISLLLAIPILLLFTSCVPTGQPAQQEAPVNTLATRVGTVEGKIDTATAKITVLEERVKSINTGTVTATDLATVNGKIEALKVEVAAAKTEAAKVTALETKITTLETKVNTWTTQQPTQPQATNPPITGYPTGQVSYTIQNPQQFYQLGNTNTQYLSIRIYNNRSDARYVRLNLSLSTYGSTTAGGLCTTNPDDDVRSGSTIETTPVVGGLHPVAFNVASNTIGQSKVTCTYVATPSSGAVTSIYMTATSGGVNSSGEYLLGSGQYTDLLILIQILSQNSALWNITVSGGDRSIT